MQASTDTRHKAMRRIFRWLTCWLACAIPACVAPLNSAGDEAAVRIGIARADTPLQRTLDRNGIELSLPASGRLILVNVAAFELIAIEDGTEAFRSRIIVGKPSTPTPLIDTYVTAVRFRPTWRPTPSMIASGEHQDRIWPPGPDNPLGLAAVRLAPSLLVYLHDTNRRDLFAEDDRALSHGCIRVERWARLVAWVLDMPLSEVWRRANGDTTHDVPAPKIPVLIRSYTQFPDKSGEIIRYPRLYHHASDRSAADTADCPTA